MCRFYFARCRHPVLLCCITWSMLNFFFSLSSYLTQNTLCVNYKTAFSVLPRTSRRVVFFSTCTVHMATRVWRHWLPCQYVTHSLTHTKRVLYGQQQPRISRSVMRGWLSYYLDIFFVVTEEYKQIRQDLRSPAQDTNFLSARQYCQSVDWDFRIAVSKLKTACSLKERCMSAVKQKRDVGTPFPHYGSATRTPDLKWAFSVIMLPYPHSTDCVLHSSYL